jgi:hypothetical protein
VPIAVSSITAAAAIASALQILAATQVAANSAVASLLQCCINAHAHIVADIVCSSMAAATMELHTGSDTLSR